ncbi:fructosyl amino acid oxidasesarcosine oxidase [Bisporella sp. PMI_857]|nr:fructosyl amino acid oxidasesarcosine oxidase [Bisporella sp. PMI_857]
MSSSPPSSILIIGSGVFGLSTAYALAQRPSYSNTKITIIDRSPFPAPDSSSIDTSRIIRADYSIPAYSSLAASASTQWRDPSPSSFGANGRYSETGLVLVANKGKQGETYVQKSYVNVKAATEAAGQGKKIEELDSPEKIAQVVGSGGGSGDWGYINRSSGWADAGAAMAHLHSLVVATKRVEFVTATVESLLSSPSNPSTIKGVILINGKELYADLTILAAGAWSGSLIDLQGRCTATGQVLCYLHITPAEQAQYENNPVLLNMSTGLFVIPPRNNILKVARHAYGYLNPVSIPLPTPSGSDDKREREEITISLPRTVHDDPTLPVPAEGLRACRQALAEMYPSLADRPFTHGRICWYSDTPTGDFLITYHPSYPNLFLATGGSGHGYKFLPVIGDKIVDCVEGNTPEEFRELWKWPEKGMEDCFTEDGSRGGKPGMVLDEELRKGSKL